MTQNTPMSHRALLAISAAAAGALPAIAEANPDAELLWLNREHDRAYAHALRGSEGLDEKGHDEVCAAMSDVEHAIHRIPA